MSPFTDLYSIYNTIEQKNLNIRKNIEYSLISTQIIDVCIALAVFDLPPYVLLEIVDWLPLYEYVEHKKKIDLIVNVQQSIKKLKLNE